MSSNGPVIGAWDWFRITGRGIVVSVDIAGSDGVSRGDVVQFELMPSSPSAPGLISADKSYQVLGIEESRCLVDHGPGSAQCVMGRGLAVREANQP